MPFQKGNQYGKTSKRGYNKETKEIREKVQKLIEGIIDTIDVEYMNPNMKLKLLNILLNYSLPKLRTDNYLQSIENQSSISPSKVIIVQNREEEDAKKEREVA